MPVPHAGSGSPRSGGLLSSQGMNHGSSRQLKATKTAFFEEDVCEEVKVISVDDPLDDDQAWPREEAAQLHI